MPEVSVIIPAYNASHYLPAAVDSVLGQTFRDFEVLVVDDGSTDATPEVMRRYGPPVRYLRQANGGVSAARNRGSAEACGRYVAFLDADDAWLPRKLERQLDGLARAGVSCRASCTALHFTSPDLVPLAVSTCPGRASTLEDLLTIGNVVGTPSTVLVERSLIDELGGFDPEMSLCADWDMWVRLASRTEFLRLDEPLVLYRQHAGNMSRNVAVLEKDSRKVLDKAFKMPGFAGPLRARRRRQALAHNFMVLAGSYFHARRPRDFVRCAAWALALDFRQGAYLAALPFRWLERRHPRQTEAAT